MGKYKVLMTYVEAGMGHIVSAEAIANALETYYPDEVEVERCHIFSETDDPVMLEHEKYLVDEVKLANRHKSHFFLLVFLQEVFRRPSLKAAYELAFKEVKQRSIEIMKAHNPDMVFCTHFTPLHCAIEARKKDGAEFLTGLYVPDLNVHTWWDRDADICIVNCEKALKDARKVGFKKDKTFLTGFILRDVVRNTPRDKKAMREKLGLPVDNFTICVASGAYAEGHLPKFMDELLKIDRRFTILLIAGTNDEVYEEYTERAKNCGNIDLRVYPFMPNAHELYCASDLFMTKAGPNAILDSVYMETPILTNFFSGPIEEITKNLYVKKFGVGLHITNPVKAAETVTRFIDDQSLLAPYTENCRKFIATRTGKEKEFADHIMETLRKNGKPLCDR